MRPLKWISWESHRRTDGICDYLAISPDVQLCDGGVVGRYLCRIRKTFGLIRNGETRVLIVQNPSIVLATYAVFLRFLYRYKLIVDAHNEAIQPYVHDNAIVRFVSRQLMKRADLTIVTNGFLANIVEDCGGTPFVLPDRIPQVAPRDESNGVVLNEGTFNLVLIATYAADEPVREVIEAARHLQGAITLYVTGNEKKLDAEYRDSLPDNIVFTGFLSNEDYWGYLRAADAIIDLTSMDNCLVCGAYEAVAVETPLILSNNKASMAYFSKGTLFSDNSTEDIGKLLAALPGKHAQLCDDMKTLRRELTASWQNRADELLKIIQQWGGGSG